ncbi:sensor histidine kinase [Duganella sp. P38]|uniref:sensor histidine kinase n=1 Tax=Duganella sp. P38 TaxID=3423949 RepID=UPI003D78D62B
MQEALANVVKHARATHATVTLAREAGALHMGIADNGKGFDATQAAGGIGLVGMRERVYAVNGTVTIDTGLAAGTRIAIMIPL